MERNLHNLAPSLRRTGEPGEVPEGAQRTQQTGGSHPVTGGRPERSGRRRLQPRRRCELVATATASTAAGLVYYLTGVFRLRITLRRE